MGTLILPKAALVAEQPWVVGGILALVASSVAAMWLWGWNFKKRP